MAGKKKINVFIIYDKEVTSKNIPADMNDVELKGYLRDLGFISSYRRSYLTTKVYLVGKDGEEDKEICMGERLALNQENQNLLRKILMTVGHQEDIYMVVQWHIVLRKLQIRRKNIQKVIV